MTRVRSLLILLWVLSVGLSPSWAQDPGDTVLFRGLPGARVIDEPDIRVGGIPVLTSGGGSESPELAPARLATTGPITLAGEQTIDGVLTAASAVVVWQQATAQQNGVYLSSPTGWTRRGDLDTSAEFAGHKAVYVTSGAQHAGKVFRIANTGTITLGVTAISLVPETATWHGLALQTLADNATLNCNPPAGQFVGAIAPVAGLGGAVGLGVPQVVAGTRINQICIIEGTHETNTVDLGDGNGVLLAQAEELLALTDRTALMLHWTGSVWREVGRSGGGVGGAAAVTLQQACDTGTTCGFTNLTQTRPYTLRGTPTGPSELIYELGGNFVRERRNADNSHANPEIIGLRADHLLSVQALLGTPTSSWQDIATIENVGGTSIEATGLFAATQDHIEASNAHAATAISFAPTPDIPATTVQTAIEQVRALVTGGTAPTGILNIQSTSPAVNAGLCLAGITVDIQGTVRPQQAQCDMGAYESLPATPAPPMPLSMNQVTPNTGATTYLGVNASGTLTTSPSTRASTWPLAGLLDRLVCQVTTAPGAGKSWTIKTRVNGADGTLTCVISDTAVECEDVAHADAVPRKGKIGYAIIPAGTPAATDLLSCGVVFTGSGA